MRRITTEVGDLRRLKAEADEAFTDVLVLLRKHNKVLEPPELRIAYEKYTAALIAEIDAEESENDKTCS